MRSLFSSMCLCTILAITSCAEQKLALKVEKRYGVPYKTLCDTAIALNLRDMQLRTVPNSICNCSSLRHLDLSQNDITKLPKCIHKLIRLNDLQVNHTALKYLPNAITSLDSLREISAICSNIIALPDSIGKLKLEMLNLNGTPIRHLPSSVFEMYTLKKLYVGQEHGGSLLRKQQLDSLKLYLPKCDLYY